MSKPIIFVLTRPDVTKADKAAAHQMFGNVKFADPVNKKYPIDTEAHVRAAWSYINMPRNADQYSAADLKTIKGRIMAAAKQFGITIHSSNFSADIQTYNDKKTILAAALKIQSYDIDDVSDSEVFYSLSDDGIGTFKGTYQRSYSIDANNQVTLGEPTQVVKRTVYDPITVVSQFDLEAAEFSDSDDTVTYEGKVFEAGNYADKGFEITEEELAQVPATFAPVDNDLEHKHTILDGKIGGLQSVVAKGKELYGKITVPKWFHTAVGGKLSSSLAWDKATKSIVGNALVLNPRIPDAQLIAAFSAATNQGGGINMPESIKKPSWFESLFAKFKANELPEDSKDFDPEQVKFAEAEQTQASTVAAGVVSAPVAPSDAAEFTALKAVNFGLTAALLRTNAETFFADALAQNKVYPAEKDSLVAQFTMAAKDDNAGVACFNLEGALIEGARVKALKDSIAARPAHDLTTERIEGVDEATFAAGGNGDGSTPTPTGKKVSDVRKTQLRKLAGIKEAK